MTLLTWLPQKREGGREGADREKAAKRVVSINQSINQSTFKNYNNYKI